MERGGIERLVLSIVRMCVCGFMVLEQKLPLIGECWNSARIFSKINLLHSEGSDFISFGGGTLGILLLSKDFCLAP